MRLTGWRDGPLVRAVLPTTDHLRGM